MEQQLTIPRYEIDIFWSDEDDAFVAVVPDLPYCSAWGGTYEEALAQVQEAIRGHIEVAQKYGDPIPEPRPPHEIDGSDPVQQTEAVDRSGPMHSLEEDVASYATALLNLANQQRAFQDLTRQSASTYAYFLGSALSVYQQAMQQATQVAQSNMERAGQVARSGMQAAGQAAQQSVEAATQVASQDSANVAGQATQDSASSAGQASEETARSTN